MEQLTKMAVLKIKSYQIIIKKLLFSKIFFLFYILWKKNQLQGAEKIMKALKILKTQEFVIHITHYKIFNIFEIIALLQNIFSEFLNWPIREEGGKIQNSKMVQLWTKSARDWAQITRIGLQFFHPYAHEIIFWAIQVNPRWCQRA